MNYILGNTLTPLRMVQQLFAIDPYYFNFIEVKNDNKRVHTPGGDLSYSFHSVRWIFRAGRFATYALKDRLFVHAKH